MRLSQSQSKVLSIVLAIVICLSGCLGSLYYKTSGFTQLLISMLLIMNIGIQILIVGRIKVHKVLFPICLLMNLFIFIGDPTFNTYGIQTSFSMMGMIVIVALAKDIHINWIDYAIKYMKICYLFYAIYTILERFNSIFFKISIMMFPNSFETLYAQYSSGCMPGLTNHYSTNGMLLGIGMLLFGSEMIIKRRIKDVFLFLVFLIAMLLTGKRSGIIFTMAALYMGFYCYMSNKKNKRLKQTFIIVVVAVIGFILLVTFMPSLATFVHRFEEASQNGDVTLGRTKMWAIAINAFKKSPLFGIGWGQFMYINLHEWNAHNIYVQLLVETGIVGFSVFIIFFIYNLMNSWKMLVKLRKSNTNSKTELFILISLAIQIYFLIYGFTGNPLYDKEVYIAYYMSCAISNAYS